jgi:hypothetical protein
MTLDEGKQGQWLTKLIAHSRQVDWLTTQNQSLQYWTRFERRQPADITASKLGCSRRNAQVVLENA